MRRPLLIAALAAFPLPAAAFDPVTDRETFVSLVTGRELTSMGVRLRVAPEGTIAGSFLGREVTGEWTWEEGLFCRELRSASRSIPRDCQVVEREGDTLRFTAEAGKGDSADLTLR